MRAAEPGFLVFVLGLGVIVARGERERARVGGRRRSCRAATALPQLLLIAAASARCWPTCVNNLPATLILVPVAAAAGPAAVLAVLIGVNVGPNLTYVGSLATLLWRRSCTREDTDVEGGEFVRLGALTVPAGIVAATILLWFALHVVGT